MDSTRTEKRPVEASGLSPGPTEVSTLRMAESDEAYVRFWRYEYVLFSDRGDLQAVLPALRGRSAQTPQLMNVSTMYQRRKGVFTRVVSSKVVEVAKEVLAFVYNSVSIVRPSKSTGDLHVSLRLYPTAA